MNEYTATTLDQLLYGVFDAGVRQYITLRFSHYLEAGLSHQEAARNTRQDTDATFGPGTWKAKVAEK